MVKAEKELPEVICILGPTGSGKNRLALELSSSFPVQIINFDSRQVYQGVPIITAQPGKHELQICPHHLYGFLSPEERISAGRFVEMARDSIARVSGKSGMPVLVGGTGMYLRSLLQGLARIPPVGEDVRRDLQARCREDGPETLHVELRRIDPEYAARISSRDRHRITRALEVYHSTGFNLTTWHRHQPSGPFFRVLKLGVLTQWEHLVHGLDARIQCMLKAGAVEEVQALCRIYGFNPSLPAMTGIGCREVMDFLAGVTDMETCVQRWFKNTRDYAKRQLTWFKKETDVHWVKAEDFSEVKGMVGNFCERS
ncbi:tRNA (adenosine(37)-N6)-dimethylallyltransferase MiaA [Desulfonatronospira sp.]|uniref:tRNA (adenosine(37)-N6)-dimethylallyltransferase MiaA n=1 Tax=Desulfonatronospira sp. TaxID=1962951 RepID=UPI0025BCB425|nr:tRNA (adenosine(37)-N6)-dimethylallyltransferase MiaA [Desulfonatronospira sp.]